MIKEIKTSTIITVSKKYCDVCGAEIKKGLTCSAAYCRYCRRDLCEACVGHEEDTMGDYRECYCASCWEIGEEYRPKIEELEIEVAKLSDEWVHKCQKNRVK